MEEENKIKWKSKYVPRNRGKVPQPKYCKMWPIFYDHIIQEGKFFFFQK